MNVILLHGDNLKSISGRVKKFIDVARLRGWRVDRFNSNSSNNLAEQIKIESLFNEQRLILIEGVRKISKTELKWLRENLGSMDGTLVFIENSVLSDALIKALPDLDKVEKFEIPKAIWKFLESVYPGNTKMCLNYLYQVQEKENDGLVLALLGRQLKDLYLLKVGAELKYPNWRVGKLKSQSEKFSKKQLRKLINLLSERDYLLKSDSTHTHSQLDLLIAETLK